MSKNKQDMDPQGFRLPPWPVYTEDERRRILDSTGAFYDSIVRGAPTEKEGRIESRG